MNVLELTPLVNGTAHRLRRRLPHHGCAVEECDLRQAGWVGILDAARRYDGDNLRHVAPKRALGEMLDELRRCQRCRGPTVSLSALGNPDLVELLCGCTQDEGIRLSGDELTPREALVLAIYADAEGNRTRAVERVLGGRAFGDIASARRKLEALAAA